MSVELPTLPQLAKDVRAASATMGPGEARTLTDLYYNLQDFRIQAGNQRGQLIKGDEPHETIAHFHGQFHQLEKDIAKALDTYSKNQPLGEWARMHVGVGPVIAAGLLAHIDITRTPSPSALWKFAGLAPGQRYVRGEKRSWNARLKVLCWKLSDSFVKQSGHEDCYYGHLYRERKLFETQRNGQVQPVPEGLNRHAVEDGNHGVVINGKMELVYEINGKWFMGGNSGAALQSLTQRAIKDKELKDLLHRGKLPDGQLDMRARRYAVKRYLCHYWQAAYLFAYGITPPRAYVFEHLGHVHEDPCPIAMPPAFNE